MGERKSGAQAAPSGAQAALEVSTSLPPIEGTSGDRALDAVLGHEAGLIASVFRIRPYLSIFDDAGHPNALAAGRWSERGFVASLHFGSGLLRSLFQTALRTAYGGGLDRAVALSGALAHEFAHILQLRRNTRLHGLQSELHADFVSGWYLGSGRAPRLEQLRAYAVSLCRAADDPVGSVSHGRPEQRLSAMLAGYDSRALQLSIAFEVGERWVPWFLSNVQGAAVAQGFGTLFDTCLEVAQHAPRAAMADPTPAPTASSWAAAP